MSKKLGVDLGSWRVLESLGATASGPVPPELGDDLDSGVAKPLHKIATRVVASGARFVSLL